MKLAIILSELSALLLNFQLILGDKSKLRLAKIVV